MNEFQRIDKTNQCHKCQSEDLVKNGTNASGSSQYHCKACGAYSVLEREERATEEKKEFIASNIALWVKKRGKRLILSIGIIPYGNSGHASYIRKTLSFSKCIKMHEIRLKFFIHHYNTELLPIVG